MLPENLWHLELARFAKGKISRHRRIPTAKAEGWLSSDPFRHADLVVVSSVVPRIDRLLRHFPNVKLIDFSNIQELRLNLTNPSQVGSDRIINALGAFRRYGRACLIVDSGTATTFCYVDSSGTYQGGLIVPGMGISSQALAMFTAKIPLIKVKPRMEPVGKTTKEAVQIGLYQGTIHMINGIISDFKSRDAGIAVIGTGAGLAVLKDKLTLDEYVPDLIFYGLAACAEQFQV
ncbi:type III pantothenate kinase [bacterium]|nr:type III pantothenate kinase [bacterium]